VARTVEVGLGCGPRLCGPGQLLRITFAPLATTAENAGVRTTATGDRATPHADVAKLRPRPARILSDE